MLFGKKKVTRKKRATKKRPAAGSIIRWCSLLLLFLVLIFSVCTAGYVIFFQTVLV